MVNIFVIIVNQSLLQSIQNKKLTEQLAAQLFLHNSSIKVETYSHEMSS